ncbi:MAG TPA: TolC family protein [Mucilaginibacter sp.]|nr:TolC family protein [Mucilaginibacter sp.]
MKTNRIFLTIICGLLSFRTNAQVVNLDTIYNKLRLSNPTLKMYDADIRSMDEAAKGARSWMPPELGAGMYMAPYDTKMWNGSMGQPGMGQFMISAQQMLPNKSKQDAEAKYMQAMSSVSKEQRTYSLNGMYADARKNYYEWQIDKRKLAILLQDEKLLHFMIESAELRYKNGMEKIGAYYKTKAALGNIQNMRIMLESETKQKRIALNTLMNQDKDSPFDIDSAYTIEDFSKVSIDSSTFVNSRSDIKAVERNIDLTHLQLNLERTKLKPEFGVRYDHMIGLGNAPLQYTLMAMVKIPIAPWSSKMYKANIEGYKWKAESLNQEKAMIINEAEGMTASMIADFDAKKKQVNLFEKNIIPALRKNFQTMQLGYEQNTEELFMLFDAWETLNMTQLDYLDQLKQLLIMQSEIEKQLEIK